MESAKARDPEAEVEVGESGDRGLGIGVLDCARTEHWGMMRLDNVRLEHSSLTFYLPHITFHPSGYSTLTSSTNSHALFPLPLCQGGQMPMFSAVTRR